MQNLKLWQDPSFCMAGTKAAEYCAQHAPKGKVDVKNRKCRTEGCRKRAAFGKADTTTAEYCAQHAQGAMVDVKNRKCRTESCGKKKTAECCAQHALNGMVAVKRKDWGTRGCGKKPSLNVTNSRTVEYCAQHARLQCDVEGFREREVGPHYSGKKTIDNVIPSGAKTTTVHRALTKTSRPSGVGWDSRKRVRHPEIKPAASKRAVARESTAGVVTMADIDGQKSPVKRNSFVKMWSFVLSLLSSR